LDKESHSYELKIKWQRAKGWNMRSSLLTDNIFIELLTEIVFLIQILAKYL